MVKRIQAAAPPAAKGAVDEITRFFEEKGPGAFEDDEFPAVALRGEPRRPRPLAVLTRPG